MSRIKKHNPERNAWRGRSHKKGGTPVIELKSKTCDDSPTGLHVFSHDEEYAQKHHLEQGPLCCEHCGDTPRIEVGCTVQITQDGSEVGEDKRLKVGAKFIIDGHRYKSVGSEGVLGIWTLQALRGTERFETSWLRAKVIRLAPIKCPGCGNMFSPNMDGTFGRHGSIGWSCDGKTKTPTT